MSKVKTEQRNHDKDEPYQQILHRLAHIEHKVESIDETGAFALRANEDRHRESVRKIFKRSKRRAQIYLAADGHRSVREIADHLGMKVPNVSPDLKLLKREGLIELADTSGNQDFYVKKHIDRTLRISDQLCDEYQLTENGLPNGSKKKGKKS